MLFRRKKKATISLDKCYQLIDYYLDVNYKKNYQFKKDLLEIRNNIAVLGSSFDEIKTIEDKMNSYYGLEMNEFSFKIMIKEIENMFRFFKRKKEKQEDKSNVNIQELKENIENEIEILEIKYEELQKAQSKALENKDKTKWQSVTIEKNAIEKRLIIKRDQLKALIEKQANIDVANEKASIDEINNALTSRENYVDTSGFQSSVFESEQIRNDIKEESRIIDETVLSSKEDDDFEKAYENYLLEKSNNTETANENIKEEGK